MPIALVILAAGKGTRMNSELPKVLHEIAGAPMLVHAMKSGAALEPDHTIVVAGHGAELVEKAASAWDPSTQIVLQTEQLGTGHAVQMAQDQLANFQGDVIVLYGDTPFIRPETLVAMSELRQKKDLVVLGFEAADPGRYGRLITDGDSLERIVEFKDATPTEQRIRLCNSGVMVMDAPKLFDLLTKIGNDNAAGEFYLTDVVFHARQSGLSAGVVRCPEAETLGVNSRAQLVEAEDAFQTRARAEMLETGVTLNAPDLTYFAHDTVIGRDTVIEPNVVFGPDVTVESGARIRAFSHLEGCHVSRGAVVGPYARLRPGTELAEDTKVGNFVEVKNASIAEGAKINHLSYVGDASVGKNSNIGAGTITCNYDGVMKHRTEIGEDVFIGSNSLLVAPVTVGDRAMTATGGTITKDVPPEALALARAKQINKPGLAVRLFDRLKAIKAEKTKGAE
ncbi:bifunctional UDP-N-acetylglucosamine diphosphorylase/glucosamine-1-phosphate N-acetyltransferase GlmU [Algirhabdus cladophorae]|uniref:bifunctional UDP-N-acetylglucosamine diphosphorylase/glucosamine-1-phosphate N-acetyltransferase GlmU n=1 Tax=Algirhabdus cladophorae TaxID=3377108 RepID=UPI003B847279